MRQYEVPILDKYVKHGDFMTDTAYILAKELFNQKDIPDAILSCNNRTTLGIIKAAREKNMKLGRDIAFVGIDHVDVLDIIGYKYSHVTRDTIEMGRMTMELLAERIHALVKYNVTQVVPFSMCLDGTERKSQ